MASKATSLAESAGPGPDRIAAAAQRTTGTPAAVASRARDPDRRWRRRVSRYAALLIVATLLLAAGWELWRWILLIVTLD